MAITEAGFGKDIRRANGLKKSSPYDAISIIKKAVNSANQSRVPVDKAVVLGLQSECYRYMGNLDNAISFAQSSIDASRPDNPIGHLLLAEAYLAKHEHELAFQAAWECFKRKENEITLSIYIKACAFVNLTLAFGILQDYIQQKEVLKERIPTLMRYQEAKLLVMFGHKCSDYGEKKRYLEKALNAIQMIVPADHDDRWHCFYADIQRKLGLFDEAIETTVKVQRIGFYALLIRAQSFLYKHEWEQCNIQLSLVRKNIEERRRRGVFTQPLFGIIKHDIISLLLFRKYVKEVGIVSDRVFFHELEKQATESRERLMTSECISVLSHYSEMQELIKELGT